MPIVVEQLGHSYGEIEALRDVTVRAAPGAITAILGPNAAGKSTLLRCIIGALRPTHGQVVVDGDPVHRLNTWKVAHRIAYVPQRSTVAAAFTVRQIVELGRYALTSSRTRIEEAMQRMEVADLADRPYTALSVGQQQRVTLARALAQLEPRGHLVLDEPFSAMDLRHVRDALAVLRDLAERGATVLIALHDLTAAAGAADEAWLLDDGRLVASGGICDVLNIERLRAVYDVDFEWITDSTGTPRLLPHALARPTGAVAGSGDDERTRA